MFEEADHGAAVPLTVASPPAGVVDRVRGVLAWLGGLAQGGTAGLDDAGRVDLIAALESVGGAVAAAQARAEVDLYESQVDLQREQGVPARRRGRGVADQIGLARRISPALAARELTVAHALVTELPVTFAALAQGRVSPCPAAVLARGTAELARPERALVDAELGPRLGGWSARQVQAASSGPSTRSTPRARCSGPQGRPGIGGCRCGRRRTA